jgi:hypothetical protein
MDNAGLTFELNVAVLSHAADIMSDHASAVAALVRTAARLIRLPHFVLTVERSDIQ